MVTLNFVFLVQNFSKTKPNFVSIQKFSETILNFVFLFQKFSFSETIPNFVFLIRKFSETIKTYSKVQVLPFEYFDL